MTALEAPPSSSPSVPPRSALAVTSALLGGLAWVALPLVGAVVAVVTGHLARRRIRASAGGLGGDRWALGGLWSGYLQLGLAALAAFVFWKAFASSGPHGPPPPMPNVEEDLPEPFPDEPPSHPVP